MLEFEDSQSFYDDVSILEDLTTSSGARCDRSKVLSDVFLGERTAALRSVAPAVDNMQTTTVDEVPLWCERTQDMSGYVYPRDTISQPSGESTQITSAAAHNKNDFYVHQPRNSSPEFILGDQIDTDIALGEESNMFENNYSELHTKIDAWLDNKISTEMDDFVPTPLTEDNGFVQTPSFLERLPSTLGAPKVEKKESPITKKTGYLSIFDSEEPHIKEDLETTLCNENKLLFVGKYEMDIAEEVEVVTESDESKSNLSPFLFESSSPELTLESRETNMVKESTKREDISSLQDLLKTETSFDLNTTFANEENFTMGLLWDFSQSGSIMNERPQHLLLNIDAAMEAAKQTLVGSLPDTPEVLKPVLDPQMEFDLVDFLLANNDPNNNAVVLPSSSVTSNEGFKSQRQDRQKASLRYSQSMGRGKPSSFSLKPPVAVVRPSTVTSSTILDNSLVEPIAGTSAEVTPTGRPVRKSATKFKKLLEEGFLDEADSPSQQSDDEGPQRKRRRTVSNSSYRRRLNSDSDRSSICEDAQKYRERRDRNNLSSKKSRQKRKELFEESKMELRELEGRNIMLKVKKEKLAKNLQKAHERLRSLFERMNKK